MRTRRAILGVSLTALVAGSAVGCGNGDDSSSALPVDGGGGGDATKSDGGGSSAPQLKHIFYIMMENHSRIEIVGNAEAPYITSLAAQYGQATSYYGVTHPSSPNYLAAISGDFQGIWDDCKAGPEVTCAPEEFVTNSGDGTDSDLLTPAQAANASVIPHWFSGANIVDELEDSGKTWIAYMESIPATGDTDEFWPYAQATDAGPEGGLDYSNPYKLYAQKHDPFMYFQDIRTNANRMNKIVPFTTFATDMMAPAAKIPNFVWISPNQCNDMHGVSTAMATALGIPGCDVDAMDITIGDNFVKSTVTAIQASPAWADGAAIVIVFDEDDYVGTSGCCNSPIGATAVLGGANVPAIVISSLVTSPVTSSDPYNHYSLLATIQSLWGLPCLVNTCGMKGTQLMTKLFLPAAPSDAGSTMSMSSEAGEAASPSPEASTSSEASAPTEAGAAEAGTPSEAGTSSDAAATGSTDAGDAGTATTDAPTGG
jgi:hypothetical protein